MGKSRKKNPAGGISCCDSEKEDKQKANRKLRRAVKQAIQKDSEVIPVLEEVSDPWVMGKDGKTWYSSEVVEENPNLIRK